MTTAAITQALSVDAVPDAALSRRAVAATFAARPPSTSPEPPMPQRFHAIIRRNPA